MSALFDSNEGAMKLLQCCAAVTCNLQATTHTCNSEEWYPGPGWMPGNREVCAVQQRPGALKPMHEY